MIRRILPLALVVLSMLVLADAASACAVCSGGDDLRTKDSYIVATLFMSVLPLSVIGAALLYLRHRARTAAQRDLPN